MPECPSGIRCAIVGLPDLQILGGVTREGSPKAGGDFDEEKWPGLRRARFDSSGQCPDGVNSQRGLRGLGERTSARRSGQVENL